MSNEMGNHNVSGRQEQDSTKLETRESMEATGASIYQQVSFPKEGIHEYNTGFASEDSCGTSDPVDKQTFNGKEKDKTETQAPEGSQKTSLGSNHHNSKDGGMQLVSSFKDDVLKPMKQIAAPSQPQPCSECTTWVVDMGNEIGNQNVSGMQEQDNTKLDTSRDSMEATVAAINANDIEDSNQQVSSPKEGIHEYKTGFASEDSSGTSEPIEKQAFNGREEHKIKTQASEGSQEALMGSNHHNGIDGGMQSVSSSKGVKFYQQIGSPSEENLCRIMDNHIQKQAPSQKVRIAIEEEETRNTSLDTKSMVSIPRSMEMQSLKSDQHESTIARTELLVPATKDGRLMCTQVHLLKRTYAENLRNTESWASIGGEGEDARNLSIETKSTVHNPNSVGLENLKSDLQESTIVHTELIVEASRKLRVNSGDIRRSIVTQDSEERGHKLEDKVADSLHGSCILHSNSEIGKFGKDMPEENIETPEVIDISNINGVKSEMIGVIDARTENRCGTTSPAEVENRGGDEPASPRTPGNNGKDCRDSQSESVIFSRSSDSFQIEASEPEYKYVVLTNDRKMTETVSESERTGLDSSTTLFSEELVEESDADEPNIYEEEFVMIGTDHGEKRKGSELCDSYEPKIQRGSQIDDENVNVDVFKLNMHVNNQSLVSDEHCEELEEETKMVIVVDTVPTESILTRSNHAERKLPTCSSPPLDPTKNELTTKSQKTTEEAYLLAKGPEGWGTIDSGSSQIEPMEDFLPSDLVSLGQSQDPKQDRLETETVDSGSVSYMESNQSSYDEVDVSKTAECNTTNSTVENSLENETSMQDQTQNQGQDQSHYQDFTTLALLPSDITMVGSQGQESTCDLTIQTCGIVLKSDFGTQTNNDHSIDEMNLNNIKPRVDVKSESNFELYTPSEAPEDKSDRRFWAEGQVLAFASCVIDAQEADSVPEVEIHSEVSKLPNLNFELPPKARIEAFNQSPQFCPEKIAKGEEFEVLEIQLDKQLHANNAVSVLASCGSGTQESTDRFTTDSIQEDINFHAEVGKRPSFDFQHPVKASIEDSDQTPLLSLEWTAKGTESSALRAGEENSGKNQLQYEEKLRTPLLDFLKGEKFVNESAQENKDLDAKKSAEDGWNSYTKKDVANSSKVRQKRRTKCTFFSNWMGCT